MTDLAIRVENPCPVVRQAHQPRSRRMSKQYRIGKRERYKTLRDTLTDAAAAPFRHSPFAIRLRHSPSPFAIRHSSFAMLTLQLRSGRGRTST